MQEVKAIKDPTNQHPIPSDWRPIFEKIIRAFASGDYSLKNGISHVKPVDHATVKQVKGYVESYGEKLVELNPATWNTSVCQWMAGYWDVLVDLWTAESGASDLVLSARVFEEDGDYLVEVMGVYVP
jgi:hypothetical protein